MKNFAFCLLSVVLVGLLARWGFERAALPLDVIESAQAGQFAEDFDFVDLGDFGEVSVLDMMQYYVDNPPAVSESGGAPEKVRFQGC